MPGFLSPEMELTRLLVVSDLDRSMAWYRDVLGAELVRQYGGSSAVFRLLDQWLLLVTGGGPTRDKPTVTFAPPVPDRVSAQLIFRVSDAEEAHATLAARGARFLTPPVHWEHGETRAFFRDPDGHLFEISALDVE